MHNNHTPANIYIYAQTNKTQDTHIILTQNAHTQHREQNTEYNNYAAHRRQHRTTHRTEYIEQHTEQYTEQCTQFSNI